MNETVLQYWNRIKQYWNKFNNTYKLLFIGTVVLSVLAIGIIIYNNSKTEYALAFKDLQPNDAAAIKQYLDSAKIPYQLSSDGTSIGVPRNQVAEVKLDVVSQGLNKNGSVGYGIFRDNKMFGTTDNEFEMKKLDAIQGELQQLINSNNAISSSKVLITMPKDHVFASENKEKASASVVVQVKPGYQLDQQKVDTMYMLVSKSVPNLPVENITISDQTGDPLPYSKAGGAQGTSGTLISQQLQTKKQIEQDLRNEIKSMLETVLGPNKVIPMVVATLNFDKKNTDRHSVLPVVKDNGLVISSQETSKSSNSSGDAGGTTGTSSNVAGSSYPADSNSGKSSSDESSKTFNYEVNRINEVIESAPYVVSDLSINLGIDKNAGVPQATLDTIKAMLASVVNTSLANSGRTLTPADLTARVNIFDETFTAGQQAPQAKTNWYLYGGIAAAALLAAAGGFVIASRRKKEKLANTENAPTVQKVEFPTIDLENVSNESQARKQLEQLAKKKPEEFVNLLRTWLVDE